MQEQVNFNNIYNDQTFNNKIVNYSNLAGMKCESNILKYNNRECPLNTFKVSDIVSSAWNLSAEDFYEFIEINVAINNYVIQKENDINKVKRDIEEKLNTSDAGEINAFISNYNKMKKYKDYYVGNTEIYYRMCEHVMNHVIISGDIKHTDIIKNNFQDGDIPKSINQGEIDMYNRIQSGHVRRLEQHQQQVKRTGYVNLTLVVYIVINMTVLMIISLLK